MFVYQKKKKEFDNLDLKEFKLLHFFKKVFVIQQNISVGSILLMCHRLCLRQRFSTWCWWCYQQRMLEMKIFCRNAWGEQDDSIGDQKC